MDSLSMAAAVFFTDYEDLPYQISDQEGGAGFNTINLIVDQKTTGFEWESLWAPTDNVGNSPARACGVLSRPASRLKRAAA